MPPEQVTFEWFAETYHFTEEMTRSLSLEALEWWPLIRQARQHAASRQQQREQRTQRQGSVQGMFTRGSG